MYPLRWKKGTYLQGISFWCVQSKSSLRRWRIHNFIELWCQVGSRGLEIWVSSTSFQKSNIGWPQQPPTERVSNISKKLDFWGFIPRKGTSIDHLGTTDDQIIRLSNFFLWKEAVQVIEATKVVEAIEVIEVAEVIRPGISLLTSLVSSRFLNLNYFDVLKKKNWNHEISYWILVPFLSEAVEASLCYYVENLLMKLKFPNLLNPLGILIEWNYGSFYPSELIYCAHFIMRYPVIKYYNIIPETATHLKKN